ncbi:WD repeat-containing protein 44 isoform X2 [Choristoneura fumiferana]|uniref:WD repeat-containing protein 44 isoform X2 n=1 Tax=Choristoneura fumiferana TaxID=7141 RepID=UPI003D155500
MSDSSDSEEFYDAEEHTPIKGSKRSSLCRNISLTDSLKKDKEKEKPVPVKTDSSLVEAPSIAPSISNVPATTATGVVASTPSTDVAVEDDRTTVKSVVQGRRRFQELRRCMQTEDEEEGIDACSDRHSFNLEQPFKVISHDTMSLQSMTSLGRIGRILSGASDSHSNLRDAAQPSAAREPSTMPDDPGPVERTQNVLAMAEPDVIASTKASSVKLAGSAVVAPAGPLPPPRRKKRNKLYGSQSLSTTDGDNLSICTTDTDDYRYVPRRVPDKQLESLIVEPMPSSPQSAALPSPASTIESLTREFQDSLELSNSKYAHDKSSMSHESRASSRSSTGTSLNKQRTAPDSTLDIKEAVRGEYVVRPADDELARSGTRTHSEGRQRPTGHSSLGNNNRRSNSESLGGCRRRSAGDEAALGLALRTRSTSPPRLTDMQILEQVTVLNLDTGERVPLSVAEHKLPQCINPLSLHIMRLTSEYIGRDNDENASPEVVQKTSWRKRLSIGLYGAAFMKKSITDSVMRPVESELSLKIRETDEESESVCAGGGDDDAKEAKRDAADTKNTIRKKTEKLKRFLGSTVKKTVDAAKSLAQEVSHARHKEDVADIADDVRGEHNIKLKASNSHKGPYDFDGCVRHVQEMGSGHSGAVWCCKFSVCGRLLATAGQDKLLRVWVARDAYAMFQDMRTKYNAEQKSSPTPSQESLASLTAPPPPDDAAPLGASAPFHPKPFCTYSGHTSDLLDVSWSKNYFILSSSMDKTVRLWHISRGECLCCFQHIDFVTAIVFHPRDDRYFLSGSLDGKLRLWNIPDKKVAVWNEVDGKTKLITAANFCQNGKFAVVGTYDGRCIFYTTDQLKYHTQIDVRSTRGKNSTGRKISGIEPMPNDDKILVTSNDSRIRLYDLRDLNLSCKYKGYVNVSSQIKASFSHDGKYIVSGSENQCIYIWKTCHDYSKFTSVRRDRNDFWEGIKAHNAVVTCAVFAPNPDHMIRMIADREEEEKASKGIEDTDEPKGAEGMVSSSQTGHVLVSTDFNGCIKVFVHKAKPKHSSLPASALA